jgi:hypothetical protein
MTSHTPSLNPTPDSGTPVCAVTDCDRPIHALGYCSSHYMRLWRYGDPEHVHQRLVVRRVIPVEVRFWSKVDFSNPDGCWPWAGSRRHAYGEVWLNGVKHYAHRVAWELVHHLPVSSILLRFAGGRVCGWGEVGLDGAGPVEGFVGSDPVVGVEEVVDVVGESDAVVDVAAVEVLVFERLEEPLDDAVGAW